VSRVIQRSSELEAASDIRGDAHVIGSHAHDLDTPSLLIDLDQMSANLDWAAALTSKSGIRLRPHIKTHKLPAVAHMQIARGAVGITVAKLGEAEVMAAAGVTDIFVANQVVGTAKLRRLQALARQITICCGLDHPRHAELLAEAFAHERRPLEVMIEIDTGQGRTGVAPASNQALQLAEMVASAPSLHLRGIYTHEGHDYGVPDHAALPGTALRAQDDMIATAELIEKELGKQCLVSIGSTPSLINGEFRDGVHECRPGTYVFFDASMANVLRGSDRCAATILATIVNKPAPGRIVVDAGAKALSSDRRSAGTILHTSGYGLLKGNDDAVISSLSDEHGVIEVDDAESFEIGQKLEIIPNHVCPAVNLYDFAHVVSQGRIEAVWPIAGRGRTQ
jgi:D-serine deaminase-like pyridoxal phosphate-dependent protein